MKLFNNKYRIETTRKPDWDYSNEGFYFITICTKDRINYFGEISEGKMNLNSLGKIAEQCLIDIPKHFPHTRLDEYIVMPNHVHFIIEIIENVNKKNTNVVGAVGAGDAMDVGDAMDAGDNVETQNFASLHYPHYPRPSSSLLSPSSSLLSPSSSLLSPSSSLSTDKSSKNKFGPQSKNLASIVRGYKIGVKKWATENNINFFWQSRFYDVIIKNEKSLNNIRYYIKQNPLNWYSDELK